MQIAPTFHLTTFSLAGWLTVLLIASWSSAADEAPTKPLTPEQAREEVDKEICVRMQVKAAKDRLEKRGELYLDSEEDFRDPKNFAVVIDREGAAALKAEGISDIVNHFQNQWIEATGVVMVVQETPRIVVSKASQIRRIPTNP